MKIYYQLIYIFVFKETATGPYLSSTCINALSSPWSTQINFFNFHIVPLYGLPSNWPFLNLHLPWTCVKSEVKGYADSSIIPFS